MRISDWSSDVCSSDLNQAVRPQRRAKPLRPFDEKQAVAKQFVEAQLLCLRRILQPVKIDMRDGNADQWRVIGLDDSEAGAWCFFLQTQARKQAPDRTSTRLNSSH